MPPKLDGDGVIQYWIFDSPTGHADVIFTDDEGGGGAGCGPVPSSEYHAEIPWAEYLLNVDPDQSTYTVFGQAPIGSSQAVVEFNAGTITADVQPNGYFIAVGRLPTGTNDTLISIVVR